MPLTINVPPVPPVTSIPSIVTWFEFVYGELFSAAIVFIVFLV